MARNPAGLSGDLYEGAPTGTLPQVPMTASAAGVGACRKRLSVPRRRVRFVTRFIYYSLQHGTFRHAEWACYAEGVWW